MSKMPHMKDFTRAMGCALTIWDEILWDGANQKWEIGLISGSIRVKPDAC